MTTVICIGDSITQGTGSSDEKNLSYPADLQMILGEKYNVINCGRSGATLMKPVNGNNDRFRDLPHFEKAINAAKEAVNKNDELILSVMLGTNDADVIDYGYTLIGPAFYNEYRNSFIDEMFYIIDSFRDICPEVKLIISSSPYSYDNVKHKDLGNIESVHKFQDEIYSLCKGKNIKTVFNDMAKATQFDVIGGENGVRRFYFDRLHPNDIGHMYLAHFFALSVRKVESM